MDRDHAHCRTGLQLTKRKVFESKRNFIKYATLTLENECLSKELAYNNLANENLKEVNL